MASGEAGEEHPPRTAPEDIRAIPARHPGRWVATVIVLYFVAGLIHYIITNPNFQWDVVGQYFTKSTILHGVLLTLVLTVVSMVIGIVLGVILAIMRMSQAPVVSGAAWVYIWFFRGTPLYVQILLWNNVAALIGNPTTHLTTFSFPFTGIPLFTANANTIITVTTAAILALGLNEGAYMSEIVRAGFLSVDEGQTEAAQSLGLTRMQTIRKVVLPQAMRVIIPPTGNETISMLKNTSLVQVISFPELFYAASNIAAATYLVIPMFILASIWYLIMTTILSIGQYYVERHYARGSARSLPLTPLQRFRAIWVRNLTTFHAKAPRPAAAGDGDVPPRTGRHEGH